MDEITLLSWNVNGARAVLGKGFLDWLAQAQPAILGLQETRAEVEQLPPALAQPEGYHAYWNASRRKRGYSGTALLTRLKPEAVQFELGAPEFDTEGRTIIAHFPTFTLLNCYFPNGGRDASRVPYKLAFYRAFLDVCEHFRAEGRAVIFCGDVNTAHREIDLANPRENREHSGFLPEERAWMDTFIAAGYVDTFRHFHPGATGAYTWWSVPTRARERNIGWRLDYFFVAQEALSRVTEAFILPNVPGSDHCPVGIRWRV